MYIYIYYVKLPEGNHHIQDQWIYPQVIKSARGISEIEFSRNSSSMAGGFSHLTFGGYNSVLMTADGFRMRFCPP